MQIKHKPYLVNSNLYKNEVFWNINKQSIKLIHNVISGKRSFFINEFLVFETNYKFIDNGSEYPIDNYIFVIKTKGFNFSYEIIEETKMMNSDLTSKLLDKN